MATFWAELFGPFMNGFDTKEALKVYHYAKFERNEIVFSPTSDLSTPLTTDRSEPELRVGSAMSSVPEETQQVRSIEPLIAQFTIPINLGSFKFFQLLRSPRPKTSSSH